MLNGVWDRIGSYVVGMRRDPSIDAWRATVWHRGEIVFDEHFGDHGTAREVCESCKETIRQAGENPEAVASGLTRLIMSLLHQQEPS